MTAYELRISDWSSDVCSSDLPLAGLDRGALGWAGRPHRLDPRGPRRMAGRTHRRGARDAVEPRCGSGRLARPARHRPADVSCRGQIGRASCRERVCRSVMISGVAVKLKTKIIYNQITE